MHKRKTWQKCAAMAMAALFIFDTISPALDRTMPSESTLSPETRVRNAEFMEKFKTMEALLSDKAVNAYIKGQIGKEQAICAESGREWFEEKVKYYGINDPDVQGNTEYRVQGLNAIAFVKVAGLLANTGQFAHVGLRGEHYGGISVAYVDSEAFHQDNSAVLRHERDEILQWENLRVNILGLATKGMMRAWIKDHLDASDPGFAGTPYEGMTSRKIAKMFHEAAYSLEDMTRAYAAKATFNMDYINTLVGLYGRDGDDGNINIAGSNDNTGANVGHGDAPAFFREMARAIERSENIRSGSNRRLTSEEFILKILIENRHILSKARAGLLTAPEMYEATRPSYSLDRIRGALKAMSARGLFEQDTSHRPYRFTITEAGEKAAEKLVLDGLALKPPDRLFAKQLKEDGIMIMAQKAAAWLIKPGTPEGEAQEAMKYIAAQIGRINQRPSAELFFKYFFSKDIILSIDDLDMDRRYSAASHLCGFFDPYCSGVKDPKTLPRPNSMEMRILGAIFGRGIHSVNATAEEALLEYVKFYRGYMKRLSAMTGYERTMHMCLGRRIEQGGDCAILYADSLKWMDTVSKGEPVMKNVIAKAAVELANKKSYEEIFGFLRASNSATRLIGMRAPDVVIYNNFSACLNKLAEYLPRELLVRYYAGEISRLPEAEYSSMVEMDINYRDWARDILLEGNAAGWIIRRMKVFQGTTYADGPIYYSSMLEESYRSDSDKRFARFFDLTDKKRGREYAEKLIALGKVPTRKCSYLIPLLTPETFSGVMAMYLDEGQWDFLLNSYEEYATSLQRDISGAMIDRINKGGLSDAMAGTAYNGYHSIVEPFERRIRLVTNQESSGKLYDIGAARFMNAAVGYREEYDLKNKPGQHRIPGREDMEDLEKKKRDEMTKLIEFFTLNPFPELLKYAIKKWNSTLSPGAPDRNGKSKLAPGTKIKLIDDRELNPLNWIINNSPKGHNTRDERRRLHYFILAMLERRIQREDDPVAKFMGDLLIYMDTTVTDKERKTENILAFLDLGMIYSTLPKYVQRASRKALSTLMETMIKEEYARREKKSTFLLGAGHYGKLKDRLIDIMLRSMFGEGSELTADQMRQVQRHIADYQDAWFNDNMLISLLRYHGFQYETGKRAVEKYILQLASSEVKNGRFVHIPRYDWADESQRKWFGEDLIRQIQQGYSSRFIVSSGEEGLKARYADIWGDMVTHLGLQGIPAENLGNVAQERFRAAGNEPQFGEFWALMSDIRAKLESGAEIPAALVARWKEKLSLSGFDEVFADANETFVDLDRITAVQKRGKDEPGEAEFLITEDPVEFIRSGEKPYYTCQRIIEPTGQNTEGRPINRIRQGQFFLGQVKLGEYPVLRSVLEIAREKKDGKKVLLVERLYSGGQVTPGEFQEKVIEWAINTGQIGYIIFSGATFQPEVSSRIELEFMPCEGPVYRDTKWENMAVAIDIEKYRKDRELKAVKTGTPIYTGRSRVFPNSAAARQASGELAKEKAAGHVSDYTAGSIKQSVDNALRIYAQSVAANLKSGQVYEIRYDQERLTRYQSSLGLPDVSTPEYIIKEYVRILKERAPDPACIKLRKCAGGESRNSGLVSVTRYAGRSAQDPVLGEGVIDIEGGDINGRALDIMGMLNMALSASNIRKGVLPRQMDGLEKAELAFIRAQCKSMTGQDVADDFILDFVKNLPKADPVPVAALEEYYHMTVEQIGMAA